MRYIFNNFHEKFHDRISIQYWKEQKNDEETIVRVSLNHKEGGEERRSLEEKTVS